MNSVPEFEQYLAPHEVEDMNNVLSKIATMHLHLQTLETRNSDRLDFRDQAVWCIRAALLAAFAAGREFEKNRFYPRCAECGNQVVPLAGTGRTRKLTAEILAEIPDDYKLPTCVGCGEEYMSLEYSEPLDKLLLQKYKND